MHVIKKKELILDTIIIEMIYLVYYFNLNGDGLEVQKSFKLEEMTIWDYLKLSPYTKIIPESTR